MGFKSKGEQKTKPTLNGLSALCDHLKALVKEKDERLNELARTLLKQYANQDRLSYIVVEGANTIIAATPSFMERFGFDQEIIGSNWYNLLKHPTDGLTNKDFEEVFSKHPEVVEKTAIILDGNGKDKYISITKETPFNGGDKYYTRVQVYEIGIVKREKGRLFKKLGLNGGAKTLAGYVGREKAQGIKQKAETEKKQILRKK